MESTDRNLLTTLNFDWLNCTNFHEKRNDLAALLAELRYRILPGSINKYGKVRLEILVRPEVKYYFH
jgi:hypothetical protein